MKVTITVDTPVGVFISGKTTSDYESPSAFLEHVIQETDNGFRNGLFLDIHNEESIWIPVAVLNQSVITVKRADKS